MSGGLDLEDAQGDQNGVQPLANGHHPAVANGHHAKKTGMKPRRRSTAYSITPPPGAPSSTAAGSQADTALMCTPAVSFSMPGPQSIAESVNLDDAGVMTPRSPFASFNIDQLPAHVERWAALQRITHEEAPTFNFVLQSEKENRAARVFGIVTFLLTQGSGKDKVFKLVQNLAALVKFYAAGERKAFYGAAEDNLSKSRKVLRTFKILSEINKIICNTNEDPVTRALMRAGHVSSIVYFFLDHVVGLIDINLYKADPATVSRVKWWKNLFSMIRLLTAFVVDGIHFRLGVVKEAEIMHELECNPPCETVADLRAELHAVRMHRGTLRRSFIGNTINMTLLLSSLNVPHFRDLTLNYIALGGIVTATLGIYKVVRRVTDNQLTLQFC